MTDKLNNFSLVLASASPRRADLLRAAGIKFAVRVADIDESLLPNETPHAYVARLSQQKAQAVAQPGEIVLGADTTVVIGDDIAGKPTDKVDAMRMLALLSGQWHEVLTGVALVRNDEVLSEVAVTRVKFAPLSQAEMEWYVGTGEPFDKAGGYGIQGYASRFIERIEGNYANVVGLPVETVYRLLRSAGFSLRL
jgi:septum formation protein